MDVGRAGGAAGTGGGGRRSNGALVPRAAKAARAQRAWGDGARQHAHRGDPGAEAEGEEAAGAGDGVVLGGHGRGDACGREGGGAAARAGRAPAHIAQAPDHGLGALLGRASSLVSLPCSRALVLSLSLSCARVGPFFWSCGVASRRVSATGRCGRRRARRRRRRPALDSRRCTATTPARSSAGPCAISPCGACPGLGQAGQGRAGRQAGVMISIRRGQPPLAIDAIPCAKASVHAVSHHPARLCVRP
jgi:hypothetical protein